MSGQFIIVPSVSLDDQELLKSPATFMTLCIISTMTSSNKDGRCFFKQETIAERLGKSRQAISRSLNTLVELGYLEIEHVFKGGRQGYSNYRLKYDVDLTVQHEVAPPQHEVAPAATSRCTNKDNNLKDKNKKGALKRDEFLRVIDRGFQSGSFKEWEHLTESEIKSIAEECLDFHCSKGEYPSKGDPVAAVRYWIRNGIKRGKIRKAVQGETTAPKAKEYPNPQQGWQTKLKDKMDVAHWNAWIRPLWHDGNGKLYAPNAFTKTRVENDYMRDIQTVLNGVTLDIKPYQPQPEKELEHV